MTIQSLSSSLLVADNIFNVDDDVDSPHRADVVEKAALLVTRWLSVIDRVGLVFLLFSLVPIKKERKKDCWCLVFFQENNESEMLRSDSDRDCPRHEIEYWKTRSTRLNLLK